ncbi:hypothetical protein [Candidatus Magnetominusculus dajiuhuensis]|uniref:hypothetical protein n=1 Tax=Candidatus Magnetominusculus dajiuhuensis TaxID=3137712 RepID=UPI003B43360A
MRYDFKEFPRVFEVKGYKIKDYGKIYLDDGEMVSFVTESGRECDFAAKDWGFYLGPSVNSRLKNQGFKVALVLNEQGQLYVNAVEANKIDEFKQYLKTNQNGTILCWLDDWLSEETKK